MTGNTLDQYSKWTEEMEARASRVAKDTEGEDVREPTVRDLAGIIKTFKRQQEVWKVQLKQEAVSLQRCNISSSFCSWRSRLILLLPQSSRRQCQILWRVLVWMTIIYRLKPREHPSSQWLIRSTLILSRVQTGEISRK